MEAVLIILGALALIPALLILGLLIIMWSAWWLHPLWSVVLVSIGVPSITYWHFVALIVFISAITKGSSGYDHAKESDSEKLRTAAISGIIGNLVAPVLVYYFIQWAL